MPVTTKDEMGNWSVPNTRSVLAANITVTPPLTISETKEGFLISWTQKLVKLASSFGAERKAKKGLSRHKAQYTRKRHKRK